MNIWPALLILLDTDPPWNRSASKIDPWNGSTNIFIQPRIVSTTTSAAVLHAIKWEEVFLWILKNYSCFYMLVLNFACLMSNNLTMVTFVASPAQDRQDQPVGLCSSKASLSLQGRCVASSFHAH